MTDALAAPPSPYYQDDLVTLYHGDSREIGAWLTADVLVTDPPYGRAWRQGRMNARAGQNAEHRGHDCIANDRDTSVRDHALSAWGDRPAIAFGDLMLAPPTATKLVGIYKKPPDAGMRGAIAGRRRDAEAIYFLGRWPSGIGGISSVFVTTASNIGNPTGLAARYGHPHAKPLDVMHELVTIAPKGSVIADPFAGAGSTLVAASLAGYRAIGVELDEAYCERVASRLSEDDLFKGVLA